MNILFLSRWFPYPVDNGSKIRIFNLLSGLAQAHQVTLISFYDPQKGAPDVGSMLRVCQDVHVVPRKPYQPDSWRARLAYFNTVPRAYVDTYSSEIEQAISDRLASTEIDLVIASQIDMAIYAAAFRGIPALFEEVEIGIIYDGYVSAASLPARLRHGLTWSKYSRYLSYLLQHFRLCTVVSEKERMVIQKEINRDIQVEVIPNCVNLASYQDVSATPQPDTLVFCGSITYRPNHDAVCWFLEKVFPLLLLQEPGLRLVVTGDHANLPLPRSDGVLLTGMVEDVRPLVAGAWMSIVPVHTGGGTRMKILESMALNTPVVSTTKGAEGLSVQPGEHLMIADTPQEFAAAVLRLLREPGLRQQLAENAYHLLRQRYNWSSILPHYLHLVEQAARRTEHMGYSQV